VTHVLTGSLRAYGEQIRLSVRLVDTATESLVWSDNFDRNLDDVFAIQDEISRQVVSSISPTLTAGQSGSSGPENKNDYVDYLRARHLYLRGRDNRRMDQVRDAKAIYEDLLLGNPNYARAHAGLADVWNYMAIAGEVSVSEGYPRARESAERALQLDDGVAEAWYALGDILVEYYWDQPAAKAAYDRAVELAPQDADGLRGYAYFLRQAGRAEEALEVYRRAIELDPLSSRAFEGLYRSLLAVGRFDEIDAMIRNATAGMPDSALGAAYAFIYEARREFDELGELVDSLGPFWGPVFSAYFTAVVERHRGDVDAGNETIGTIIGMDVSSGVPKHLVVARYYALFGDFEVAIDYLDAGARAHEIGLGEALSDYQLVELRKDPRFWDWVERAGIKPLE
jgi:serine/threonine-protein kinase